MVRRDSFLDEKSQRSRQPPLCSPQQLLAASAAAHNGAVAIQLALAETQLLQQLPMLWFQISINDDRARAASPHSH